MKRILSIILIAVMCLSSLPVFFVSAGAANVKYTDLVNLFTAVKKGGVGIINAEGRSNLAAGYGKDTNYWCTEPIPMNTSDTLYFIGDKTIDYHLSLFGKDGNGLGVATNVKPSDLTVVERLGEGKYSIYSYKPTSDVGFVRVTQRAELYNAKCVLVTKNQAFDKKMLDYWCLSNGGDLLKLIDEYDTESPLYQKSAFFLGDSITYGSGEKEAPEKKRAWAGRLADMYDMDVINGGDGGASLHKQSPDGFNWIESSINKWSGPVAPDMVIMHGGVNDARLNVPLGTIDSTDLSTFAGGLNSLFKKAKELYPSSDLFYIANFFIPENKGYVSHMEELFALAKQICEKYDVCYIDLAGNTELNETLANKNAAGTPDWSKYMPDKLHPNAAGYDVITPYIAEALENFYDPPVDETPGDEGPDGETPDAGETPDDETPEDNTTAPATTVADEKGCGGFAAVGSLLALIALTGAALVIKKK